MIFIKDERRRRRRRGDGIKMKRSASHDG